MGSSLAAGLLDSGAVASNDTVIANRGRRRPSRSQGVILE
jgi:hypothetical protein